MEEIHLAFKAHDIHELLCHGIAEKGGFYRDAGIHVRLLDSTFVPDEALPDNTFLSACGAVLAGFLSGKDYKVVFVACDRPMFWVYGRQGIEQIEELAQGRVATFPEAAPPAQFLKELLANAGVAPGLVPCRDDVSRLALVSSGSVDAALLSSNCLSTEVNEGGCRVLAFVGDEIRLPSAGLAVTTSLFNGRPDLVEKMVWTYRRAMKCVFDENSILLKRTLSETFAVSEHNLDEAIKLTRQSYNSAGFSCDRILIAAVEKIAAELGRPSRDSADLYELNYIRSLN